MFGAVFRRSALISQKKDRTRTDLSKANKKTPSFSHNLCSYFVEYSGISSIHGLKYLGDKKRTRIEKLWWLIVFFASLYFSVSMIIKTYIKWQSSPVIVSFTRSPTPVWQIPFPAVTICSETKTRQTVFNYTATYHLDLAKNTTKEEAADLEKISLVCDSQLHLKGNNTIGYDTIDFLKKVAPSFDEFFYQCKWINQDVNCSALFTPVLTEEGVCFTFNMLNRKELFQSSVYNYGSYLRHYAQSTNWSLEGNYPKNLGKYDYPKRAISAGEGAGLSLLLRTYQKDLDYICRGPVQGFKVLLHQATEVFRLSQQYFRAPLNQEVVVAIKPDIVTTSEELRSYQPHRRQCYFPSERQLSFYKVYTRQNCEVECLTNFSLQVCNCVSYHMPHTKETSLCGPGKKQCLLEAQQTLLKQEITTNFDQYQTKNFKRGCDCLPACTSLTYNSEISQAYFNWPKVFQAFKQDGKELTGAKMTKVTLFFKEMQFITSERNELYGPTDFLASCGGLLGLFMGFSLLSVFEILYFLTLRLMCNVKHFGVRFWSGEDDEYGLHTN